MEIFAFLLGLALFVVACSAFMAVCILCLWAVTRLADICFDDLNKREEEKING